MLIDVVWGESFLSMLPKFFNAQDDNTNSPKEIHLTENSFMKSFEKAETTEFSVSDIYSIILGEGPKETILTVVLQEQEERRCCTLILVSIHPLAKSFA